MVVSVHFKFLNGEKVVCFIMRGVLRGERFGTGDVEYEGGDRHGACLLV